MATTDTADLSALLASARVIPASRFSGLAWCITVTVAANGALIQFDPNGHGSGNTVACLQGKGGVAANPMMLVITGDNDGRG